MSSLSTLSALRRALGPWQGPTRTGWWRFCHRGCGTDFTLGAKGDRWHCFRCGARGRLRDLVRGAESLPRPRAPAETPQRAFTGSAGGALPWRAIPADGEMDAFARLAVQYLEARGVPRLRAALLGLGYGVRRPVQGCVVAPWQRPDGSLGGWQARKPYDPRKGPKTLNVSSEDFDVYGPARGAMMGFERVPDGDEILLVEGPFDLWSAERVVPSAALIGSRLFPAQLRRLQKKRPRTVFYGLDPDTFQRRRFRGARSWTRPKATEILAMLARAFGDVRVVRYPKGFDGDFGGRRDRSPHPRSVIERLLDRAERWP